jgi:hypothetical protein
MARSKNLHIVQIEVEVQQPDDPISPGNWAEGIIQVDAKLSQELGRTIRNGNSFRLVGFGSTLRGFTNTADLDVGFAGTCVVQYCPLTKNGVSAHQKLYKQWMRQKQLKGGVGEFVRYDDFELGWNTDLAFRLPASRQSTIFAGGMGDTNDEDIVLYGSSSSGDRITLEAFWDNLNPIATPSEDPFGTVIKTAKFLNKFPDYRALEMPTAFSAVAYNTEVGTGYSGSVAMGQIQWLPSDNHLSHMTGTLKYFFKGIAPDTDVPPAIPDELKLTITLVYEGWSSLSPVTSTPSKKITGRTKKSSKTGFSSKAPKSYFRANGK